MTEYIKTIRRKVGHDPVMQVGASVIVINEKNELLLQQRADSGSWGYHGGSVDLGEDVESAARRELTEETGLIAEKLTLLGVFSGENMHWIYPNGDEVYNVDIVYMCRDYTGDLRPQADEVRQLAWFPVHQLPEHIFEPNQPALKAYLAQHS